MTASGPVTAVQTLVLTKGGEPAFAAWLAAVDARFRRDTGDRAGLVRLDQDGGIVHLLYRFADGAAHDAWIGSAATRTEATDADRFSISRWQRDDAPAAHFRLPSQASAPKWKRVLVSWTTVFPLLLATSYAARALVPDWPRPLTLGLSSLAITLALNLAIFPLLNRRLDPWMLKADDGGVRTPGAGDQ